MNEKEIKYPNQWEWYFLNSQISITRWAEK